MKTFLSVFAALVLAGGLFTSLFWAHGKLQAWEKLKNEALDLIDSRTDAAHALLERNSAVSEHSGIARLTRAIEENEEAITLSTEAAQVQGALREILHHKPFFLPLTSDEKNLLKNIEPHDVAPSPNPESSAATISTPDSRIGSSVKMARSVKVTIPSGEVIVSAGSSTKIVSIEGQTAYVMAYGYSVPVPLSAIQAR